MAADSVEEVARVDGRGRHDLADEAQDLLVPDARHGLALEIGALAALDGVGIGRVAGAHGRGDEDQPDHDGRDAADDDRVRPRATSDDGSNDTAVLPDGLTRTGPTVRDLLQAAHPTRPRPSAAAAGCASMPACPRRPSRPGRRRRSGLAGGRCRSVVSIIGLVVVAAAVLVPSGPRHTDADHGAAPRRVSSRRPRRPGSTRSTTATSSTSSVAASAVFDCDDDGRPDLYLAGGSRPAALFRNDSPIGGALRFTRLADPATDLDGGHRRLSRSTSTATASIDLAVLRHGENVLLRGIGDCRFERANETWTFDGGGEWTTAFSATWEAGSSWPTLAIGNYHDAAFTDPDQLCQAQRARAAGCRRRRVRGARARCRRPGARSRCSSATGDHSGQRDLRVSNDHHYYSDASDGEEQLWRIDARRSRRTCTPGTRAGRCCGSGAWASPARTSTATVGRRSS